MWSSDRATMEIIFMSLSRKSYLLLVCSSPVVVSVFALLEGDKWAEMTAMMTVITKTFLLSSSF